MQSRTASIPPAGTVTLRDRLTPVTTLTIAGQGSYVLDPGTGVMRFTPVNGFVGTATPVDYTVTDSYGQAGSSIYTATATLPAPRPAAPLKSTGAEGATQRQTVAIPAGGAVTLLDGTMAVTTVTNAGQGTYALDPVTGVISFTPVAGYSGSPTPVTYQLSDAYGQFARSIYAPLVTAPGPTTTPTSPTTTTSPAPTATSPAPIATTSAPTAISTASSTTNTAPTTTDTASTSTSTMPFAAAAATSTPPMAGSLAYTGSSATKLVRTALLLVMLGGALNAAAHYRRRPRSDQPPRGHRRH